MSLSKSTYLVCFAVKYMQTSYKQIFKNISLLVEEKRKKRWAPTLKENAHTSASEKMQLVKYIYSNT